MESNPNLGELYKYGAPLLINKDLNDMYKLMEKEFKYEKKPDSIVQRLFIDAFGVIVLYVFFFFLCDFTRSGIKHSSFYGIKWLFFGPYYYITKAPIMTRIWKSKKFLEDLAEAKSGDLEYDPQKTCTQEGAYYRLGCEKEENHPHRHPVRDNLGKGLDWVIRHTIGQHFGGVLGNATCQDQATTIARDCADQRLMKAWNCYLFVCAQHGVEYVAPSIDYPNTPSILSIQTSGWDDRSKQIYGLYYGVYTALYDVGSAGAGSNSRPTNLNPVFDVANNYCINGNTLFSYPVHETPSPSGFGTPPWYDRNQGVLDVCYFQNNYTNHLLDYWDPV